MRMSTTISVSYCLLAIRRDQQSAFEWLIHHVLQLQSLCKSFFTDSPYHMLHKLTKSILGFLLTISFLLTQFMSGWLLKYIVKYIGVCVLAF